MAIAQRFMVDKDLLNKMLEMRGRNMTYKQIAEALDVSVSLVGKELKEVRDNPEMSINFIRLTDFETGQTILSFSAEDFEKYRNSNTLYYLGLKLFEIKDGLIHSTDFGRALCSENPGPLPEWYGEVTKLYGTSWRSNISDKANVPAISRMFVMRDLENEVDSLIKRKILDNNEQMVEASIHRDHINIIINMLQQLNVVLHANLKSRLEIIMERTRSDWHWLSDPKLLEKAEQLSKEISEYNKQNSDFLSKAEYLMKCMFDEEYSASYIFEIYNAINEGWRVDLFNVNTKRSDEVRDCYKSWRHCVNNSIPRSMWLKMYEYGIVDKDRYLELENWLKTSWELVKFGAEELGKEQDENIEWSQKSWKECVRDETIDDKIGFLESNGWSPSVFETVLKIGNIFTIPDIEVITGFGLEKIRSAASSLKYCEENQLTIDARNVEWFEGHNWKIPKLPGDFKSYISSHIYNLINDDDRNFIHTHEFEQLFSERIQPCSSRSQNFQQFLSHELSQIPFNKICSYYRLNGRDIIVRKPAEPELLNALHRSGIQFEDLETLDFTKAAGVYNYFKESEISFTQDIASWAISNNWDIPKLGDFGSYKEHRLYQRILEFDVPVIRLDKLLPEFNAFDEPGESISSEQELHEILIRTPFNQICKSSDEAGMVFLDKAKMSGSISPIVQEKIVIKEVIVEKEVFVPKIEYVDDTTPLFDISEFEKIANSNDDYVKRAKKNINDGDLLDSINSVWRLFRIQAAKFLGESKKKGDNFNVELIDKLAEKLQLNERLQKKLHQLRRARNDFDNGKSESPVKPTTALVKSGLMVIEMMM